MSEDIENMHKRWHGVILGFALFTVTSAVAQITGSGTVGKVPQFTGSSTTVGDSPITVKGRNVGVWTAEPIATLDVNGNIATSHLGTDTGNLLIDTADNAGNITFGNNYAVIQSGGNFGIGTTLPAGIFQISEPVQNANNWINFYNNIGVAGGNPPAAMNAGMIFGWNASSGAGESEILYGTGLGASPRLDFGRWSGTNKAIDMSLSGGNVGIGTMTPSAKLEVNGGIKLTGNGNFITFPDGTTQSTAYTGVLCGGDYAESIDVTGDRTSYAPGDVLVIDVANPGTFLKSTEPYSRIVSGIYSTKPGVVGRRRAKEKSSDEVPMAMIGIVPTKVVAENGPIQVGDLLVTSSTPGHAMKGTDQGRLMGAVIGKALGSLSSGTGVIEVLVTLQ